jgi:hypothetical protein
LWYTRVACFGERPTVTRTMQSALNTTRIVRTILGVAGVTACLLVCGVSGWTAPQQGKATADGTKAKKVDFKVTAESLDEEVNRDRKAAGAKYLGKLVEVRGVVDEVMLHQEGKSARVYLMRPAGLFGLGTTCRDLPPEVVATLGRGQKVVIRGKINDVFSPPPVLAASELMEKGAETVIRIDSEKLAAEYTADRDATVKKLDRKTVILSGAITAIAPLDGFITRPVELKGDGVSKVLFEVAMDHFKTEYKVGQLVPALSATSSRSRGEVQQAFLGGPHFRLGQPGT